MNYILKLSALVALLLVLPGTMTHGGSKKLNFDKEAFYVAMSGEQVDEINLLLIRLKESAIIEKTAYEGALLMKKAGLVKKAKVKLELFRSGRKKLEAAIKNDEKNIEYHFLRLIIQENSPKVVKYKHDLQKDAELIRISFKKLHPVVQQAVRDYSKKSAFLKPAYL